VSDDLSVHGRAPKPAIDIDAPRARNFFRSSPGFGGRKRPLGVDYAANPRIVEEAEMHILEAAMVSNLRRNPQNRTMARSGPPNDGLSSIARLAAAVVLVGLFAVGLDNASTGALRDPAAAKAEAKVP
jgi:hypothetical protein